MASIRVCFEGRPANEVWEVPNVWRLGFRGGDAALFNDLLVAFARTRITATPRALQGRTYYDLEVLPCQS